MRRAAVKPLRGLAAALVFFLVCAGALGQDPVHPLKPPDRSSPRATLKTFLESGDAVGEFLARSAAWRSWSHLWCNA